jgi:hypothetical protein
MRGWAKPVIDRRCLAGGGHSAWSAPPKAVDEDPDETGALLDFHFTNPSAGSGRVKKLHAMKLACLLVLLSRSRPCWGGREKKCHRKDSIIKELMRYAQGKGKALVLFVGDAPGGSIRIYSVSASSYTLTKKIKNKESDIRRIRSGSATAS